MSPTLYLMTICLPLLTILAVFGLRSHAAIQQAKARQGGEEAYRQIAEASVAAQSETVARLASIDTSVADLRARLAAVETILKAVE